MFILPNSGLRLRAFRSDTDTDNVLLLSNDLEVSSMMNMRLPRPMGKDDDLKNVEDHTEIFCIVETIPSIDTGPSEANFVGITGLWKGKNPASRHVMFGIGLMKKYWNKGYGSEITEFIVDYAFRHLNMHRISLGVVAVNARAIAVYKKW